MRLLWQVDVSVVLMTITGDSTSPLTRAGQSILTGKALDGGQLALNADHDLPNPV